MEVTSDGLQIFGLARGETVVLGYLHEKPVSIRVRVVPRPQVTISPAQLRRQGEMAQGSFGSSVQIANAGGQTTTAVVNDFNWTQLAGAQGRLYVNTQVEDNDIEGGHAFNIRHGSIAYRSPGMDVSLLDNLVSLTDNGYERHLSPFAYSDSVELRGAGADGAAWRQSIHVLWRKHDPVLLPDAGFHARYRRFSFQRKQYKKLNLFATTSYINSPVDFLNPTGGRQEDWMQTGGFGYQASDSGLYRARAASARMAGWDAANSTTSAIVSPSLPPEDRRLCCSR